MEGIIKVLLVDDHKMLREGIKQLLEFDSHITVISQASTAAECIDCLQSTKPDVVVLDINLPDDSGLKLLKSIRQDYLDIKFLILTVHNEIEYLLEAFDCKADGYILKDADSSELIKAINMVYAGDKYIQPSLIPQLNSRLLKREDDADKKKSITKRENEILVSIALGKSNKDIADYYDISERTVKNHVSHLFKKIGVSDRTQAAVFAIRNNLVEL